MCYQTSIDPWRLWFRGLAGAGYRESFAWLKNFKMSVYFHPTCLHRFLPFRCSCHLSLACHSHIDPMLLFRCLLSFHLGLCCNCRNWHDREGLEIYLRIRQSFSTIHFSFLHWRPSALPVSFSSVAFAPLSFLCAIARLISLHSPPRWRLLLGLFSHLPIFFFILPWWYNPIHRRVVWEIAMHFIHRHFLTVLRSEDLKQRHVYYSSTLRPLSIPRMVIYTKHERL